MRRRKVGGRSTSEDRGAAAVEFALVAPLLLMVLFGIIEFGLLMNQKQGVHAAAREGARLLSLPTTTGSTACARTTQALSGVNGTFSITVKADGSTVGTCPGYSGQPCGNPSVDTVSVTVSTPYDLAIPGFDRTGVAEGRAVFRCEH